MGAPAGDSSANQTLVPSDDYDRLGASHDDQDACIEDKGIFLWGASGHTTIPLFPPDK